MTGVFISAKKDGTVSYRASITFRTKHISLGSFDSEEAANAAYLAASVILCGDKRLTPDDYPIRDAALPFKKWVVLTNFKNNGIYIKTPIYLQTKFFQYFLSPTDVLLFDADDLFYYSNHSIMRRGNHLFVAEYGMQTNIVSRYGIRNFARQGIDYRFVNGDDHDFRYENIEILNPYQGVTIKQNNIKKTYTAKIHIHGNYTIGVFQSIQEAAIAYNKTVDFLFEHGFRKNFEKNYIENMTSEQYRNIYNLITIPDNIKQFILNYNSFL